MKKKKLIIILGVILIIFTAIGISYAYYIKSYSQENSNIAKTKCLNLSITNEKNDIKLDEQYPIPDSEGKKLTPYQFTITNTCEQFISYNVNLEALEGTTMDSNAIKVMVNNEAPVNLATLDTTQTSINNSVESRTLVTGSLGSGDSVDYAIRLWMDYGDSVDLSSMNKVFNSKVVVTATIGTYKPSNYVSTLHDAILVNEYGVTDVDNAIKKIEAKGTPDLSQTAPVVKWNEKYTENVTEINVQKPSLSTINSDEFTNELSDNDSKIRLYKNKKLDSNTGIYELNDYVHVDPSEIDFTDNNVYYFCEEATTYDESQNKVMSYYRNNCSVIYEVIGAKKIASKTIWGNNNHDYDSITYTLKLKEINVSVVEVDKSDKGLYYNMDDFGTTYYYRGNVVNNNVSFAGYDWKIIRINGDNTIRIIYNGKRNDSSNGSQSINGKNYLFNKYGGALTYVGYMYGNENSNDIDEIYSNVISSDVKQIIDEWYGSNIYNTYGKYISDNEGFCGDRTLYSGDGISTDSSNYFGAYGRSKNNKVQFTCPNVERDLYTIKNSKIGNKSLTYPVGLITFDELVFAGLDNNHINKFTWVYSSQSYWTMTPCWFNSGNKSSYVYYVNSNGWTTGDWIRYDYGVRPVINLKADVKISGGIGTINDPYIIKTE